MNNIPITIGDAAINAVLGYAVVFFGLVLLMCVVIIMGKIMVSRKQKAAGVAVTVADGGDGPTATAVKKSGAPPAPGSAGELKLYDTDPKSAAMVMAIVADEMQTPLNELRFKSIKEVK